MQPREDGKQPLFYGWVIVGITFLVQFILMGSTMYSFGVLQKPMAEELAGGTRFGIAFAPTLMFGMGALVAPFAGRWLDRGPIRLVMVSGAALVSLGFALLSQAQSLGQLLAIFALPLGIGVALMGHIASSTLVSNWFNRQRGLALGISQFSVSFSGVVAAFGTTALVEAFGWRGTVGIFALLPLLGVAPLIWRFIVDRPEQRGLGADGDPPAAKSPTEAGHAPEPEWNSRQAFSQRLFWMVCLGFGPCFAITSSIVLIFYTLATDRGFTGSEAATLMACLAWMAALGKPSFGWLVDRLPLRTTLLVSTGAQIVGLLLILQAQSFALMLVAAVVYGIGFGGVVTLNSATVASYWGRDLFGRILGLMMSILLPVQIVGLPLANWLFDQSGSYHMALWLFLGGYAISLATFALLPATPRDAIAK